MTPAFLPVRILAARLLPNAPSSLCRALGVPEGLSSLALLTTDCDDATYIALDEATKASACCVPYARSFYAGASNAATPYAGEVIGLLAAPTPEDARTALDAACRALEGLGFSDVGVPCLAHTVSRVGSYLAGEAGIPPGSALAYCIAPPLESLYGLDAALKAADVTLCRLYAPPTETNFGGGLMTGTQSACSCACDAFREAVAAVAKAPIL